MNITPTALPDLLIVEPKVFADERGFFLESFNQRDFEQALGQHVEFVQDNHSLSAKGVLRGLHLQLAPHAQGKLIRVTRGAVFDVAVDLQPRSATFGRWVGVELSASNFRMLWIPPGFAHGFLVISGEAELQYKVTTYYDPAAERSIRWDDPSIGIQWPDVGMPVLLSNKDRHALSLQEFASTMPA